MKVAYVNNTGENLDFMHDSIMQAIANGGKFGEDYADLFVLKCTDGVWALYVA